MAAIPESTLPGHRQLHERVAGALDLCQETQDIDFKESSPWEALKFHVARTAMAMANLRDGGVVIIGVTERDGHWQLTGVADNHLSTFDEDDVNDFVNKYSTPALRVELVVVRHLDSQFLAIRVPEFTRSPIICKRDGPPKSNIHRGTVYVRPLGKPQTTRPTNAEDLDALLQLAAERRAVELLAAARRVGMQPPTPDEEAFDRELGGL